MRTLRSLIWTPLALTILYIASRTIFPGLLLFTEVILYNLIPLTALIVILVMPIKSNQVSVISLAFAIATWLIASLINSYSEIFSSIENSARYTNLAYLAFYPFLFLSLIKISKARKRFNLGQFMDFLILALLLFSLSSTLFLTQLTTTSRVFTEVEYQLALYLIADLGISLWVIRLLYFFSFSPRNLILSLALALFVISDLTFIWSELNGQYQVGGVTDVGWIAAFALIAVALSHDDSSQIRETGAPAIFLASALLCTPALLIYLTLNLQSVSSWLLIPTASALALLIIRIALLLQVSRKLSSESHLAITDELTGLANRRRLVAELSALKNNEGAFLLLDLNGFKPINDQYGHGVGDQLLQEVAERFKRALPSGAIIGRLGGDEFGIIIRGSYEETLEGAYALRASLSYPFTLSGQKISVGVSIGHVQNDGAGELLKRADLAMYEAKRSELGVVQS